MAGNKLATFESIVHQSIQMRNLVALAQKVSATEAVILITGESGTGKELMAQAIHNASDRKNGPFVAINCAAVPDTLLEAELFGHQKGAFTGAVSTRQGRFELAEKGTLFLDEIGDMSLAAQAKILRAIEERAIQPVGATHVIPVDIRIICATNQQLHSQVRNSLFRQDLYYRLNEVTLVIPPLRERKDDIDLLIHHFIRKYRDQYGKPVHGISQAALQLLMRHPWPGNVRELEHVIHHAILMAEAETIWLEHLPTHVLPDVTLPLESPTVDADAQVELISLEDMEGRHITRVLKHVNWNKSRGAKILGISRPTLDRKIERYQLGR